MNVKHEKPPLGVTPRFIFLEKRKNCLKDAIDRYIKADLEVPLEWVEEYNEINDYLKKSKFKLELKLKQEDK